MPLPTPSGSTLRSLMLPVLLMMSLTGCGGGSHSNSCELLPLREYDDAKTAAIVKQAYAAGPDLKDFYVDAVTLRMAIRACRMAAAED